MPVELMSRAKIKFIYDQKDMKNVPAGFYDIRMEVLKNGKLAASEYQYNAVRVYEKPKSYQTNYDLINVTDSQISLGANKILDGFTFKQETHDRMIEFVNFLNKAWNKKGTLSEVERKIQNSAFITFNGDVHNGGSPLTLQPRKVATTYQREAQAILNILRNLPIPIFLTVGNHDGYAATGITPGIYKQSEITKYAREMAKKGVISQKFETNYEKYLAELKAKDLPGGKPVDIHTESVFTIKERVKHMDPDTATYLYTEPVFRDMDTALIELYQSQLNFDKDTSKEIKKLLKIHSDLKTRALKIVPEKYFAHLEAMVNTIENQVATGKISISKSKLNALSQNRVDIIDKYQQIRKNQLAKVKYHFDPVTYKNNWIRVAASQRNYMLYDGVNQWRTTYGPTYQSWGIGDNLYVNLNSYELRQHMRTGYGMYTVNYGGGISQAQMDWVRKSVNLKVDGKKRDIILLTHHDFRGGHKNVGHGFYVRQVPYQGMGNVAKNFVMGEHVLPNLCKKAPKKLINSSTSLKLSCLHDGLQEWMRAEFKFDCAESYKYHVGEHVVTDDYQDLGELKVGDPLVGSCDLLSMRLDKERHPLYSGYQLVHLLAVSSNIHTYIIGHTHYNTLEILQKGDKLVEDQVLLDEASHKKREHFKTVFESLNPVRFLSWFHAKTGDYPKDDRALEKSPMKTDVNGIESAYLHISDPKERANAKALGLLTLNFEKSGHTFERRVQHPVVILRFTSVAKLSEQKLLVGKDKKAFGFTLLSVDDSVNNTPMVNAITLMKNDDDAKSESLSHFDTVAGGDKIRIDRSSDSSDLDRNNYFNKIFDSSGARPMVDNLADIFDDYVDVPSSTRFK